MSDEPDYKFTVETTGMRVEEYAQWRYKYSIEPNGVLLIIKKAVPAKGEPEKMVNAYGPGGWLVLKNLMRLPDEGNTWIPVS